MKSTKIDYEFWYSTLTIFNKLRRRKPGYKSFHKKVLSATESTKLISDSLDSGEPFMVGKIGESELEVLRNYFAIQRVRNRSKFFMIFDYLKYSERFEWTGLGTLVKDSGFFPANISLLNKFSELYIEIIKDLNFFGTAYGLSGWYNNKGEDLILKSLNREATIISVETLDPFLFLENAWTKKLRGRKVLVIHPFEDSIKKNYENREKHFPVPLLPLFELITYKPVQSIAYSKIQFLNWFEALESMYNSIDNIDFDVALIGCGAYGLPLASHIKKNGKQAIHIGGALQLYFGISGNRWDKHPVISSYRNEFWTRPLESERPANCELIGNGGKDYW